MENNGLWDTTGHSLLHACETMDFGKSFAIHHGWLLHGNTLQIE
jgi:hypothetical protein